MKKLYIETYGCQMNVADSEVVASVMKMAGYETTDSLDEADAVFLNTCSVRENAENKIYKRLEALAAVKRKRKSQPQTHLQPHPKGGGSDASSPKGEAEGGISTHGEANGGNLIIGVLGCMAERVKDDLLENHHCDLVAGPDSYLSLPDLIAQAELGQKAINTELSTTETYRDIVPMRLHGQRIGGFVSIMRGCNNFCHYCIVPYTRGRERSRDVESILREVQDLRERGFKEVTLLGQNVNSYRSASGVGFPELLRLVAEAAAPMRVRFTTSHPAQRVQAYPPACAERQQPNTQTDEPPLHPRVVSGARGCHTAHSARLLDNHRHIRRLSQRDRGRPPVEPLADARSGL